METSRLAALFFLLYVALDFGNPMMPGAVSFDPDDCVEAVRAGRVAALADTATARPAPVPVRQQPARLERPALSPAPAPGGPRERLAHARRVPPPAAAAAPSSEDH